MIGMLNTQSNSRISLISLVCAIGLCSRERSFGRAVFVSRPNGFAGWRLTEGHGDDDEDDEEQDEDEEEDDEDDDEEEPWQVCPLSECRAAAARTAGTPLCAPSRLAALPSGISP